MISDLIPPTEDGGDTRHFAIRQVTNLIPGFGGNLTEFFNWVCAPPIQKRLDAWRESVALALLDQLRRMEIAENAIEHLQQDDRFISTMIEAARIAATVHAKEKLDALRNAVCNVAAGLSIEEVERQLFLRYLDELTETHLAFLSGGQQKYGSPKITGLTEELHWRLWRDLIARGLLIENRTHRDLLNESIARHSGHKPLNIIMPRLINDGNRPEDIPARTKLSQLGKSFMRFISDSANPADEPAGTSIQ